MTASVPLPKIEVKVYSDRHSPEPFIHSPTHKHHILPRLLFSTRVKEEKLKKALFIHSFIHSFIHPPTHSFIHSYTQHFLFPFSPLYTCERRGDDSNSQHLHTLVFFLLILLYCLHTSSLSHSNLQSGHKAF